MPGCFSSADVWLCSGGPLGPLRRLTCVLWRLTCSKNSSMKWSLSTCTTSSSSSLSLACGQRGGRWVSDLVVTADGWRVAMMTSHIHMHTSTPAPTETHHDWRISWLFSNHWFCPQSSKNHSSLYVKTQWERESKGNLTSPKQKPNGWTYVKTIHSTSSAQWTELSWKNIIRLLVMCVWGHKSSGYLSLC